MKRFKLLLGIRLVIPILALFVAAFLAVQVSPVFGQEEQTKKPWTGKLRDGKVITEVDLKKILGEHKKWVESGGKEDNKADLDGANLSGADLSEAILSEAILTRADLSKTKLQKAIAPFAIFAGTKIDDAEISDFVFIGARGLTEIKMSSPTAVVNLRKNAKDYGFRDEERALTSALHKFQMEERRAPLEKFFDDYVLGGCLTVYGAEPWNSLKLLAVLIAPFSIVYIISLNTSRKMTGIWAVRHPDRVIGSLGKDKPIKLTTALAAGFLPYDKPRGNIWRVTRWWGILKIGLYFSILSAFSIGWRELNFGVWITRLQRQEYTLRATGWVRTVSGVQSLISVYLLALWALTYFGRPFE